MCICRSSKLLILFQYCASKFALEGWYESLKQETLHLGIKSLIFELGYFRTKVFGPENIKFRSSTPFAGYDNIRDWVKQTVQGIDGKQPGDPGKAVKIMIDIVRGEGVAEGKSMPERLPLGQDALATMRKKAVGNLAICDEWENVIRSTDVD
jgi:hypothetical protein